jgi:hypothetical protein
MIPFFSAVLYHPHFNRLDFVHPCGVKLVEQVGSLHPKAGSATCRSTGEDHFAVTHVGQATV